MSNSEIMDAAEDAIRSATGDWSQAIALLGNVVAENDSARKDLTNRALKRELRLAATRLGMTIIPCPICAEEIPVDSENCSFCGSDLQETPFISVPVAPAKPSQSAPVIRHFTLMTGWVLIVLIVILIITFAIQ